ncbi:MAG TPA: hypothetical protein VLC98_05420 [Phnomibacter sp.]|nr:hypothetical protein [Phnomibacter sp.]
MEKMQLNKEMNIQVRARFIAKGADAPIEGAAYKVLLFDRDFFDDQPLGTSHPDANGVVHFLFSAALLHKGFLDDALPDFFFVLYKHGDILFKSQVMHNVYIDAIEQYRSGIGEIIDLGTFLVEG